MELVRRICVSVYKGRWHTNLITLLAHHYKILSYSRSVCLSGKACHEMRSQTFLNVLWLTQKEPDKELDMEDSIGVTCIHYHRCIVIPDLLSSYLLKLLRVVWANLCPDFVLEYI